VVKNELITTAILNGEDVFSTRSRRKPSAGNPVSYLPRALTLNVTEEDVMYKQMPLFDGYTSPRTI